MLRTGDSTLGQVGDQDCVMKRCHMTFLYIKISIWQFKVQVRALVSLHLVPDSRLFFNFLFQHLTLKLNSRNRPVVISLTLPMCDSSDLNQADSEGGK